MSDDFLTADINELLGAQEIEAENEDEKAFRALQDSDAQIMTRFRDKQKMATWPDPVRKRFLR